MISNCGHDENGRYSGGIAGDQTGTEWQIIPWYNRPWTCVLRYPDRRIADTVAEMAIQAAVNDNIGYDQAERTSFWSELSISGYWPKNIKNRCEADCSAGVAAIVKATGYIHDIESLRNISPYMYTGNERSALKSAGFEVLTDTKYLTSDRYLFNGDILLYDGHHTAINVTDGSCVTRDGEMMKETVKMKSIDPVDLRKATCSLANTARIEGWRYGDSKGDPRSTHVVSCDRLIFQALKDLGYTDQRKGLETVVTMESYLLKHGFLKIAKKMYLTHGDIILMKKDGQTSPTWEWHTFLCDQYWGPDKIWKYDFGSQERIRTPQPFKNVPLDEWPNKSFYCAFRCPMPDANIKTGYYKIVSGIDNRFVMDVEDASKIDGANIQLYKDNGTDAQVFYIYNIGDGRYSITPKCSNLRLEIEESSMKEGANLRQNFSKTSGFSNQRFFIQKSSVAGYDTIVNVKSGFVLDVEGGLALKRTNIRQWSSNGTAAQRWKFVPVGE